MPGSDHSHDLKWQFRRLAPYVLVLCGLVACGAPERGAAPSATAAIPPASPTAMAGAATSTPTATAPNEPAATAAPAATARPEETAMPDEPSPQSQEDQPTAPSRPALRATPLAPAETAAPAPTPPNSSVVAPPLGPALTAMVDTSRADLARRLSIPVEQVELVQMWTVVWPDGGLGCPRPGMVYPQVQADGLLIRLRVGDQIYDYHTDGIKPPFLCEQTIKRAPAAPAPGIDVNK